MSARFDNGPFHIRGGDGTEKSPLLLCWPDLNRLKVWIGEKEGALSAISDPALAAEFRDAARQELLAAGFFEGCHLEGCHEPL